MAVPGATVMPGSNITYTINFVNNGPGTPSSSFIRDVFTPAIMLTTAGFLTGLVCGLAAWGAAKWGRRYE